MTPVKGLAWIFLFSFLVGGAAAGQKSSLGIGDDAPAIDLAAWLNTEDTPTLQSLSGRLVMVEFWGTW